MDFGNYSYASSEEVPSHHPCGSQLNNITKVHTTRHFLLNQGDATQVVEEI